MNTKHNVECLSDDSGIEILVGYDYEKSDSQIEDQGYEAGLLVYTELTSVEVVIAGIGINLLPMLTDKQKIAIINELNYE